MAISYGHLLARRAAAPFLLVMRRAHALRHRPGQRRRASVALFHLSPNLPCRSTSGSGRASVTSDPPRQRRRPRPCSVRLWTFALVGLSRYAADRHVAQERRSTRVAGIAGHRPRVRLGRAAGGRRGAGSDPGAGARNAAPGHLEQRRRAGLGALADRRPLAARAAERLGRRVDQRAAVVGLDAAHGAGAVLGRGRDPAA